MNVVKISRRTSVYACKLSSPMIINGKTLSSNALKVPQSI
ncbi:hypothetical protein DOY81_002702 [Sarcophaga bullata]|nr:hypothetical protein DOY81_002702 [Sarcophaga bullata]